MRALPERGKIGIFNRSYYEEVLVVRVHPELLAREQIDPADKKHDKLWATRFREINDFERYLVDNGIEVLKFFLHLSKEEQKTRFSPGSICPDKNWKFSEADVTRARLLGRLPAGLRGDAEPHQHAARSLARDSGGPQMVCATPPWPTSSIASWPRSSCTFRS